MQMVGVALASSIPTQYTPPHLSHLPHPGRAPGAAAPPGTHAVVCPRVPSRGSGSHGSLAAQLDAAAAATTRIGDTEGYYHCSRAGPLPVHSGGGGGGRPPCHPTAVAEVFAPCPGYRLRLGARRGAAGQRRWRRCCCLPSSVFLRGSRRCSRRCRCRGGQPGCRPLLPRRGILVAPWSARG